MDESYPIYDFNPHNLPPEFLQVIGFMTTCASQTESIVEMAIAGCLGIDDEFGMTVTTHMSMPQRLSALRSAANIKIGDLDALDKLDQIIDEIETSFVKRHEVVHRCWCLDPVTNKVFTVMATARTRVETGLVPMSVNEIESAARLIYLAGMELMSFLTTRKLTPPFAPAGRTRDQKSRSARKKRRKDLLRGK